MKKLLIERHRDILFDDSAEGIYTHHPKIAALFWKRFMQAEELSQEEWEFADRLAGTWNTCACGSINDGLPRTEDTRPLDSRLETLGVKFMRKIGHQQIDEAREVFIQIQERAGEVLFEQEQKDEEAVN